MLFRSDDVLKDLVDVFSSLLVEENVDALIPDVVLVFDVLSYADLQSLDLIFENLLRPSLAFLRRRRGRFRQRM